METAVILGVVGVIVVVFVNTLAPKIGVAAPLVLTLVGIGVSLLPQVGAIEVEPEWIIGGLLPPLLYAAAVNIPVMEFRRDFTLISGFAVVLVLASAVLIGFVMTWLIPGLPLALGIAVGAIASPTDAVATSIVRKVGVSTRIVTVLEGESLLNDATALVLLRSAVAAVAATVSVWEAAADFVYAVVLAVLIGAIVGRINLFVRARVKQVASNVSFSFVVPFLAYLPTEHFGGSGLVAAVTAGIVSGLGRPKKLAAEARIAEHTVWQTIELLAESAVFLIMGLQLYGLVEDLEHDHGDLWATVGMGAIVATVVIAVRTVFVTGSVFGLARRFNRRTARAQAVREKVSQRLEQARENPEVAAKIDQRIADARASRPGGADPLSRFHDLIERRRADLEYLAAEHFGWREGMVLVWGGMRGAVTLAAAQSLPRDVPHRPALVLIAFTVAVGTLLVQGATLAPIVKKLDLTRHDDENAERVAALRAELSLAALDRLEDPDLARPDGQPYDAKVVTQARHWLGAVSEPHDDAAHEQRAEWMALRLDLIEAQREELLRLRRLGTYPCSVMNSALTMLDADQIVAELHER